MSFIARFVQDGKAINYTPSAAVAAGDVVVIGGIVGVAKLDIAANTLGAIALEGLYEVAKVSGTAVTAGATLYWNATDKVVTPTKGDLTTVFGKAAYAAAAADGTVLALLGK